MNWIDVKKMLPGSAKLKLVHYLKSPKENRTHTRSKITMARYSGGQWRFVFDKGAEMKSERVTHWMHLPKVPPKTKQQSHGSTKEAK